MKARALPRIHKRWGFLRTRPEVPALAYNAYLFSLIRRSGLSADQCHQAAEFVRARCADEERRVHERHDRH